MHYYQFNIGDYQSHTAHLSDIEDLAYRRLLDLSYLHEKPIPDDIDQIARLIRMRSHSDCIAIVLREFFVRTEEGWINERVLKEIALVNEKSSKARDSAMARWKANAVRTHSEGNATHDTRHITQDTEHTKKKSQDKPAKSSRLTRIPDDFCISERVTKWAAEKGFDRLDEHLDAFVRKAKMKAYKYTDWDLAFMEAIREDWAKIRGRQTFAQQAADIARVTVPGSTDPDPALQKIEEDRKKAVPMPDHIKAQINSVLRKVG